MIFVSKKTFDQEGRCIFIDFLKQEQLNNFSGNIIQNVAKHKNSRKYLLIFHHTPFQFS